MENRPLIMAYLIVWLIYLAAVHGYGKWQKLRHLKILISHAAQTRCRFDDLNFIIGHGASVRHWLPIASADGCRLRRQVR